MLQGTSLFSYVSCHQIKEFVWLSLLLSLFLSHDRYSVLYMCSPVQSANDSLVLHFVPGYLFVQFAVLHFLTEIFIAFEVNSACLEVFKISAIIVLWAEDKALLNLSWLPRYFWNCLFCLMRQTLLWIVVWFIVSYYSAITQKQYRAVAQQGNQLLMNIRNNENTITKYNW